MNNKGFLEAQKIEPSLKGFVWPETMDIHTISNLHFHDNAIAKQNLRELMDTSIRDGTVYFYHIRTSAQNAVTAYRYDLLNNRTTVKDAKAHTTTVNYNDLGQREEIIDPLMETPADKTQAFVYDQAGNLIQETDRQDQVSQYTYDQLNRLVQTDHLADGSRESIRYDDFGDLIENQNSDVTYTYSYTPKHQLKSKTDSRQNKKLNWTYDAAGRLILLQNTSATGKIINNSQYTRDHLGNPLSQTDTGGTGQWNGPRTYTYSPAYQLLSVDYLGNTSKDEAYTYDAVGNCLLNTKTGSLAGPLQKNYSYDDNGSLTSITVPSDPASARNLTFSWDANHRLAKAAAFRYDPSGYRIQKIPNTNPANTRTCYLEGEHLETIYDGQATPALQAQYFRGSVIDEIVNGYQRTVGGLINSSYHHDALQSVLGQSGHDGTILAAQSYSAFGRPLSQSGASNNALKYTGRELDGITGLYYYRARYYDPLIGRFISEDPKGFAAGVNFYAYVNNNPVNGNDPEGLDAYTIGVSAKLPSIKIPYLNQGVPLFGISAGFFVTGLPFIPSTTKENFDIGVYGQLNPGAFASIAEVSNYLGITDIPSLSQGVNFGAVTIDGGVQFAGRSGLNGLSADLQVGAINRGVTLNFDTNSTSDIPSGMIINVGPQFRVSSDISVGGSYSVGDFFNGAFKAYDAVSQSVSSYFNSSSAANGGFVLYPNKSNTNQMQSVYKK